MSLLLENYTQAAEEADQEADQELLGPILERLFMVRPQLPRQGSDTPP